MFRCIFLPHLKIMLPKLRSMASLSIWYYGILQATMNMTVFVHLAIPTPMSSSSVLPSIPRIRWIMFRTRFVNYVITFLTHIWKVKQWISEILHFCAGLPIILVGCKKDLRRDVRRDAITNESLQRVFQRPVTPEEVCTIVNF